MTKCLKVTTANRNRIAWLCYLGSRLERSFSSEPWLSATQGAVNPKATSISGSANPNPEDGVARSPGPLLRPTWTAGMNAADIRNPVAVRSSNLVGNKTDL